jgi:hypothetical protein
MKQDQSKNMKPWAITSAFFPAHKDTMLLLLSSSPVVGGDDAAALAALCRASAASKCSACAETA